MRARSAIRELLLEERSHVGEHVREARLVEDLVAQPGIADEAARARRGREPLASVGGADRIVAAVQHEQRQRHVATRPGPVRSTAAEQLRRERSGHLALDERIGEVGLEHARIGGQTLRDRDPPTSRSRGSTARISARDPDAAAALRQRRAPHPRARRPRRSGLRSRANVATTSPPMLCPTRNSGMLRAPRARTCSSTSARSSRYSSKRSTWQRRPAGAPVAAVVVGVDGEAALGEPLAHVLVAAAVLGEAVHDEHRRARALGDPAAPEQQLSEAPRPSSS